MSYSKLHSAPPPSLNTSSDWKIVFTSPPPSDCLCPSCGQLSLRPHTTSCSCHQHSCLSCLVAKQQQGLPPCQRADHESVAVWRPNKEIEKKIDKLRVYCPLRSFGCKWVGELGELLKHINEGMQWGQCKFVPLNCPLECGGTNIRRGELKKHLSKCPKRSHECPYCLETGTYQDIATSHTHQCPNRPIKCPNGCGIRELQRRELEEHVSFECPLATVACKYSYVGCKVQMQRRHYQKHLKQFSQTHLLLVATETKDMVGNEQSCELIGQRHGN